MSRRYTYSRTLMSDEGLETFTAQEFDSFDEAKKAVDKGIHDRKLEIAGKKPVVPATVVKEAHQGGTPGTGTTPNGAATSNTNPR